MMSPFPAHETMEIIMEATQLKRDNALGAHIRSIHNMSVIMMLLWLC